MAGLVSSVEVYKGELYVSGDFEYINGNQFADHFAKWDGTTWTVVGKITLLR
jgi:hypothetical protein